MIQFTRRDPRSVRLHKYIRFTFIYTLSLPPRSCSSAHEYPFITSSSIIVPSYCSSTINCPFFQRAQAEQRNPGTQRPEESTSTTFLSRHLSPPAHLSHIGPACPDYIDAPAAASVVVVHAPRTSPWLNLDDTCARDTAPVSMRCARIGCRVSVGRWSSLKVRNRARRRIVVIALLARRGDKAHIYMWA